MREIKEEELQQYGIRTPHHIMDNGELRFRIIGSDGSAYIRTEATDSSGWQKSHYHETTRELYLVQCGSILFAELNNGEMVIRRYEKGEYFVTHPMVPHNVYLSPKTILHTIKYGECKDNDWIKCETLDRLIMKKRTYGGFCLL